MGFFKRLFSRSSMSSESQASESNDDPFFAFICLNDVTTCDLEELRNRLTQWFGLTDASDVSDLNFMESDTGGSISFTIRDQVFLATHMPAPIPKPDIQYACQNAALFWKEAWEQLEHHRSHLLVVSMGTYDSRTDHALALSRAMAALSECHDTAGIYWGHAATVHSPEFFTNMLGGADGSMETLPITLWVGFLLSRDDAGAIDCYTCGLNLFAAKEVEVIKSDKELSAILDLMLGLSQYLAFNGDVIGDGDTVGGSAEQKIRTSYQASAIGREGQVIRLLWE